MKNVLNTTYILTVTTVISLGDGDARFARARCVVCVGCAAVVVYSSNVERRQRGVDDVETASHVSPTNRWFGWFAILLAVGCCCCANTAAAIVAIVATLSAPAAAALAMMMLNVACHSQLHTFLVCIIFGSSLLDRIPIR